MNRSFPFVILGLLLLGGAGYVAWQQPDILRNLDILRGSPTGEPNPDVATKLVVSTGEGTDDDLDVAGKPKYNDPTYLATADEVILKMFEMGNIGKDDVIFDLGCGDGRILYMAAQKFGCRGVGLETNPQRIAEAMHQAKKYDVGRLVEIRHGDALKAKDIGDATVVVLYMFHKFMNLWQPTAKEKLKPGTRILSHDYAWDIGDWEPDRTVVVRSSTRDHKVHMWTIKGKHEAVRKGVKVLGQSG